MISITDNAKKYLTDMVGSSKYAHLAVTGGGCSGFQYKWDIVEDDSLGTVIDDI